MLTVFGLSWVIDSYVYDFERKIGSWKQSAVVTSCSLAQLVKAS